MKDFPLVHHSRCPPVCHSPRPFTLFCTVTAKVNLRITFGECLLIEQTRIGQFHNELRLYHQYFQRTFGSNTVPTEVVECKHSMNIQASPSLACSGQSRGTNYLLSITLCALMHRFLLGCKSNFFFSRKSG